MSPCRYHPTRSDSCGRLHLHAQRPRELRTSQGNVGVPSCCHRAWREDLSACDVHVRSTVVPLCARAEHSTTCHSLACGKRKSGHENIRSVGRHHWLSGWQHSFVCQCNLHEARGGDQRTLIPVTHTNLLARAIAHRSTDARVNMGLPVLSGLRYLSDGRLADGHM